MRRRREILTFVGTLLGAMAISTAESALYIPNKLFVVPYNFEDADPQSTLNITGGPNPVTPGTLFSVSPIPDPFVINETNINGPVGTNPFPRNEHLARFATAGETSNGQSFGHKFQRSEAWDISYDLKIEANPLAPRKEAGLYFQTALGNDILFAATNAGHFTPGPGEITTQYDVIPHETFSAASGPNGDYNHNGVVDAADYTIWRDTLGSTTDFRANGTNEGASLNVIDQADYEVWKAAFGQSGSPAAATYTVGDTLNMRTIYTPPVTNPSNSDPFSNVITPGKMEYQIRLNGGPMITSGPLDFTNALKGIPDDTLISLCAQNVSTAPFAPDSSKVTFSNFDFNGPLSGSGVGSGAGNFSVSVPEPSSVILLAIAMGMIGVWRRRVR